MIVSILAVILCLFVWNGIALGATDPTATAPAEPVKAFEFYPAETGFGTSFVPSIDAGNSAALDVVIANTGQVEQTLRTYAVNGSTKEGGGFGAGNYGDPPNEVTAWLTYPEETFTIEPGKGIKRTFTIAVPKGTAPGEYLTSVAAEDATPQPIEGSENFNQRLRFVVPILITVPGDLSAHFEVGDIKILDQSGIPVMEVGILNSGDKLVRPKGTVEFLDKDGALIATLPVQMGVVFARDQTIVRLGIPNLPAEGPYGARVQLSDAETGATAVKDASGLELTLPATPVPQQVVITSASATPKPAADNVQFAEVAATIVNNGEAITNAQLSLVASKDGAEVERFPISQSLSLPAGETPVTTRYIPAEGWSSGTWTFELLVETVDPSGAAVVMTRLPVDGTVVVP